MTATDVRPRPAAEPERPEPAFRAPRGARPLVALELALFVALVAAAALAYEPVFASWGTFLWPVLGAIGVATLLAIVNRRHSSGACHCQITAELTS